MKKIITATMIAVITVSTISFAFSSADETAKKVANKPMTSQYAMLAELDD